MTPKQFEIIFQTQIALATLGALVSLIRFQKREIHVRLVGLYCLASALADGFAMLMYKKINPNYVSAVFYIITFPLLAWMYYSTTGRKHRIHFSSVTVFFSLFAITNVLVIQKSDINSYSLILFSIIIIICCLYYFYWLLKELPTIHLHRLPMFWINSALMVYFSGNLFLFVFTSYLINVLKITNNILIYWSLHNFLGIFEFSLIIFALWIDLRNIKLRSL